MARLRSPNGAEWSIVSVEDGVATLSLEQLPTGEPARLTNHQQFTVAEIRAGRGWRGVA